MTGPISGTRPDEIRRHNRTALLRRLHVDGPSTRASLAAELGLNRSTIKALVDGLAEAGVVAERVPALRSGAGRPSLLVLPQPQASVVMAIDVRVEHVAMGFVGLGGEILGRDSWNPRPHTSSPAPRGNGRDSAPAFVACVCTVTDPVWLRNISRTDPSFRIRVVPSRPSLSSMRTNRL